MSAIAGWVSLDGRPAPSDRLDSMLQAMRGRGDTIDSAVEAGVALGQVHLHTGTSPAERMRPVRVGGGLWLAADARIDARADLLAALRNAGRTARADAPHAELLALALVQWGQACGRHLQGDFACAAWDPLARQLTCVRDHFGVRPLYYTLNEHRLALASDIRALLALPDVQQDLDETAVADYLMFGGCMDPERSIFSHIRCLPPAHTLVLDAQSRRLHIEPYWQLGPHEEVRVKDPRACAAELADQLQAAVSDRLPQGLAAYQLSGGLDSTSIAALAAKLRGPQHPREPAYTLSASGLDPQEREADFAELAARDLPVTLLRQELHTYTLFERADDPRLDTASPMGYPLLAAHRDMLDAMVARGARVLFSGYAADAAMAPSSYRYARLLRQGRLVSLSRSVQQHWRLTGSLRGMGLRHAVLRRQPDTAGSPDFPDWLAPDFARRVDARGRWNHWWHLYHHATDAHQQLSLPWMHRQFEAIELWPLPLVGRYPFLDLRVLQFLMALPNALLQSKRVLRDAMAGMLPPEILARPKTALAIDLARLHVTNGKIELNAQLSGVKKMYWLDATRYGSSLDAYIRGNGHETSWHGALTLGPLGLASWLDHRDNTRSEQ